jgi:hypothetical protein
MATCSRRRSPQNVEQKQTVAAYRCRDRRSEAELERDRGASLGICKSRSRPAGIKAQGTVIVANDVGTLVNSAGDRVAVLN